MAHAHEALRLIADLETGLRGYLIAGESRSILTAVAWSKSSRSWASSRSSPATTRCSCRASRRSRRRIISGSPFAEEGIARRSAGESIVEYVRTRRGLDLTNQRRTLLNEFIATERQLRAERTDTSEIVTTALIGGFLLFSLIFSGLLVFLGRRDLTTLSATYRIAAQAAGACRGAGKAGPVPHRPDPAERVDHRRTGAAGAGPGVLNFLSRYIDAAVGALYVVQDGKLQRVAEYAYDPEHLQSARSLRSVRGWSGRPPWSVG